MLVCGIVFKNNGKIYNFDLNNTNLEKNDYAIVITEKGEQIGKVVSIKDIEEKNTLSIILRKATEEDYNIYLKNLQDAKKALLYAKEEVQKLDLNMQLVDAGFSFDKKQLLFNFISDERVDFRELVKNLAAKYKTRIELHQMGVRDKSKEIGGIGYCGRILCCNNHLNHIDTITINMAKNQNIALNPSKINGSCGRLLCCLAYEDETYSDSRRQLLNYGDKLMVNGVEGRIVAVDLLTKKYKVDINGSIEVVDSDQK